MRQAGSIENKLKAINTLLYIIQKTPREPQLCKKMFREWVLS